MGIQSFVASHMGGVWERQVRTVRKVMNSILREQVLDVERLITVFTEAEPIVNSRPITLVSDNPKDREALTPNHLLLLKDSSVVLPGNFGKEDFYRKGWRHVQVLVEQFGGRWVVEYLTTLLQRSKWTETQRSLRIGDLELIVDNSLPRRMWPFARVTGVGVGRDGLLRFASVDTSSGTFVRPNFRTCMM